MSDDKDDVEKAPPRVPARRDRSEKALGLEVARLFGMNPRTMMAPGKPPDATPAPEDEEVSDDAEAPEA